MSDDDKEREQVNAKFAQLSVDAQRKNQVHLLPLPDEPIIPKKGKEIAPFDANDPTWIAIHARFKKEFPDGAVNDDGALNFPSAGAAKDFFGRLAKENTPFLAIKMENGKKTDDLLFSCGNGKLYEGSFNDIKLQLNSDLKTTTDPSVKTMLEEGLKAIQRHEPHESVELAPKVEEPTTPRPGGG